MTPETQIKFLVKHIQPLADCLTRYRSCAMRIHVRREDWNALHANPEIAISHGFVIHGLARRMPEEPGDDREGSDGPQERLTPVGRITYQSFEVVPIDTHKRRKGA